MKYQIIGDSGLDLNETLKAEMNLKTIPFTIYVENEELVDNDPSKLEEGRNKIYASREAVRSGCPSPYTYEEAYEEVFSQGQAEGIFVVTLSSKLSGSFNSANLAAKSYKEAHPEAKIHVFDSLSASAGETNVAYYLYKLENQGLDFDEIVEKGENYVHAMRTFFILERMDILIRNGRIKKTAGLLAKTLKIKPIMMGKEGEISLYEMSRGFKKSLVKLAEGIGNEVEETKGRILFISHTRGLEKAQFFKKKVEELYDFDEIHIVESSLLASTYADDGGIVVAF